MCIRDRVPVVFSGVNYPNQELLAQYPNITGYIDKPDYLTTCRMIERIMGLSLIHIYKALEKKNKSLNPKKSKKEDDWDDEDDDLDDDK